MIITGGVLIVNFQEVKPSDDHVMNFYLGDEEKKFNVIDTSTSPTEKINIKSCQLQLVILRF